MRRRWPGTRVRIVAVTADAFEDTREQCLAGGFDGWCAACPPSPSGHADALRTCTGPGLSESSPCRPGVLCMPAQPRWVLQRVKAE